MYKYGYSYASSHTLIGVLLIILLVPIEVQTVGSMFKNQASTTDIVVAVDLAHGESDKYLNLIMGNITWVTWRIIESGTTITQDILSDVDVLIIGQPTISFSLSEYTAIKNWFFQGNKVLWIAGDSDYGYGSDTQEICNSLLEFVGTKLRLELASIYDDIHNAQRFYRVLTRVIPDNITELYTFTISENIVNPVLMHGPTAIIWVDETKTSHDPVDEVYSGLIRIVWSYDTAYVTDNNPPKPMLYNPLYDVNRSFVMVAAEYWEEYNNLIVASGESPYGGYEPMFAWEYYNVTLDGPEFIENMFKWFEKIIIHLYKPPSTTSSLTETTTLTRISTKTITRTETIIQTYQTTLTKTINYNQTSTITIIMTFTSIVPYTTTYTTIVSSTIHENVLTISNIVIIISIIVLTALTAYVVTKK
ncbi:MAG: hypothetical protein B6U89_03050 [Desulfurococcales archaeon ex4484_58]|nr:MAG: hypothetical protein B6U89_03050 [Desulfurococcales archaeon ex4484_58]